MICAKTDERAKIFLSTQSILLVKLTSDGSKWPKLSFGEVLYRLEPRYNSFGDYYESVLWEFHEVRVYFLAEICL